MNSRINFNYHTHSLLCDGKDTLEEMVKAAIDKGFDSLGFSGHSYTAYDESYCMTKEGTKEYISEISHLKEKYSGQIEILCGIEQDFGSDEPTVGYDYVIGSVHALFPLATSESQDNFHGYNRKQYFYVDYHYEDIENAVNGYFKGDQYAFCQHYYDMVSILPQVTNCNIIGHFDLLTKFSQQHRWFDENHPKYIDAVNKALDKLVPQNVIFEINTGAIAKKLRTTPYPSPWILEGIAQRGGQIMINSDCHNKDFLDCEFDNALKLAKSCGFDTVKKIIKGEFINVEI